jgi:hypothetical protein
MRRRPILFPLILIALGVLFLLGNFNLINFDFGQFISTWWPMILILIGLDILFESALYRGRGHVETLSIDRGGADRADVRLDFGAGKLRLGAAAPGKLIDGTFGGGVRHEVSADGRVHLRSEWDYAWWGWWRGRGFDWTVGVTAELPVTLRVDSGAADTMLDLTDLKVTDFQLHTGASSTVVKMPRSAGLTSAKIEAGAASVVVLVPDGVAARIQSSMGLGSTDIDQRRFPFANGEYASPDYDTAPNRLSLRLEGGVGSLTVK